MGEVIINYTDDISKQALQFCFENMICPADLKKYIEFADAFCPMDEDAKMELRDLANLADLEYYIEFADAFGPLDGVIKDELRDLADEAQKDEGETYMLRGHVGKILGKRIVAPAVPGKRVTPKRVTQKGLQKKTIKPKKPVK